MSGPDAPAPTRRPTLFGLAAAACLAAAGALEGLLLARGPILADYSAVRLGPHGVFVSLPWLCVLGLGALGAAAGLAAWTRTLFLTLLAVPVSWSLAHTSRHPWWIPKASSAAAWAVQSPSAAVLAGHALAVGLVCAAALIDALARHRAALLAQDIPAAQVRSDTWRLGRRGLAAAALALLLAFVLPGLLDSLGPGVSGAVRGPPAFAALLASTALLLLGLALLASPGRRPGDPTRATEERRREQALPAEA